MLWAKIPQALLQGKVSTYITANTLLWEKEVGNIFLNDSWNLLEVTLPSITEEYIQNQHARYGVRTINSASPIKIIADTWNSETIEWVSEITVSWNRIVWITPSQADNGWVIYDNNELPKNITQNAHWFALNFPTVAYVDIATGDVLESDASDATKLTEIVVMGKDANNFEVLEWWVPYSFKWHGFTVGEWYYIQDGWGYGTTPWTITMKWFSVIDADTVIFHDHPNFDAWSTPTAQAHAKDSQLLFWTVDVDALLADMEEEQAFHFMTDAWNGNNTTLTSSWNFTTRISGISLWGIPSPIVIPAWKTWFIHKRNGWVVVFYDMEIDKLESMFDKWNPQNGAPAVEYGVENWFKYARLQDTSASANSWYQYWIKNPPQAWESQVFVIEYLRDSTQTRTPWIRLRNGSDASDLALSYDSTDAFIRPAVWNGWGFEILSSEKDAYRIRHVLKVNWHNGAINYHIFPAVATTLEWNAVWWWANHLGEMKVTCLEFDVQAPPMNENTCQTADFSNFTTETLTATPVGIALLRDSAVTFNPWFGQTQIDYDFYCENNDGVRFPVKVSVTKVTNQWWSITANGNGSFSQAWWDADFFIKLEVMPNASGEVFEDAQWAVFPSSIWSQEALVFDNPYPVTWFVQWAWGQNIGWSLPYTWSWNNNNNPATSWMSFDPNPILGFRKNWQANVSAWISPRLLTIPWTQNYTTCDTVDMLSRRMDKAIDDAKPIVLETENATWYFRLSANTPANPIDINSTIITGHDLTQASAMTLKIFYVDNGSERNRQAVDIDVDQLLERFNAGDAIDSFTHVFDNDFVTLNVVDPSTGEITFTQNGRDMMYLRSELRSTALVTPAPTKTSQTFLDTMTANVYTVNFPTAMPDLNYTVQLTAINNQAFFACEIPWTKTLNSVDISAYNINGGNVQTPVSVTIEQI